MTAGDYSNRQVPSGQGQLAQESWLFGLLFGLVRFCLRSRFTQRFKLGQTGPADFPSSFQLGLSLK